MISALSRILLQTESLESEANSSYDFEDVTYFDKSKIDALELIRSHESETVEIWDLSH